MSGKLTREQTLEAFLAYYAYQMGADANQFFDKVVEVLGFNPQRDKEIPEWIYTFWNQVEDE